MMLSRILGLLTLASLILIRASEGLGSPHSIVIPNPLTQSQSQPEADDATLSQNPSHSVPALKPIDPSASGMQEALPETPAVQKPKSRTEKVKEWRMAAVQHNPGQPDSAAVKIGSWQVKDLEDVLSFVTKLATQPAKSIKRTLAKESIRRLLQLTDQEVQQGDLNRVLKQAALLHTDIALLELGTGDYQDTREGMGAFIDGRIFIYPKTPHWEFARRLIDSVSLPPSQDPMILQWYIATTAHMQACGFLGYARTNLKRALEKFPTDCRILFYAGVLHETWASPIHQNVLQYSGAKVLYDSKESELKLARQFFEKAITSDPSFSEAHLRLGRVLGLLGHHDQAIAELQQAASSTKDLQLLYYTSLYLGYEFEMLSRRSEARDQYERAAMLYPNAQSPLLALSQLAHSSDDVKGALLALQRIFELTRTDLWRADPWWVYHQAHARNATALITEMYRTFGELPR